MLTADSAVKINTDSCTVECPHCQKPSRHRDMHGLYGVVLPDPQASAPTYCGLCKQFISPSYQSQIEHTIPVEVVGQSLPFLFASFELVDLGLADGPAQVSTASKEMPVEVMPVA